MSDKLNVAVIGAGYWGRKHVDEFSRLKSANLAAVSDLMAANREHCEKNYKVRAVSDYRDILADKSIDAVSICTNNETHYSVAKEALLAGKHVLVEKPLTMDVKTSEELVALAKKHARVLCVGHLFRFNNAVRKMRQLFQDGFFGKPYFMKFCAVNHNGPIAGRSVLMDLGPHMFDIPNFITGWWPKKSTYFGSSFRRSELEEVTYLESDYGNGFYLYGELSWLTPGKKREIFISGEKACASADLNSQKIVAQEVLDDGPNQVGKVKDSYAVPVEANNALLEELESFISDCKDPKPGGSANSGEIGLLALEALLACKKI